MEGRSVTIALIGAVTLIIVSLICAVALIIAALIGAGAHCRILPALCNSPGSEALVDVSAAADWQNTGVAVATGQSLSIAHESGMWNRCGGVFGCPDTGPDGDNNESEDYSDNVLSGCKHSALIARIGTKVFCVGKGFSGLAPAAGQVELRINDRVLQDNQGSLKIRVSAR